jgi:hypothetical protein
LGALAGVTSAFSLMDEFSDDWTDRDEMEDREEEYETLLVVTVPFFLLLVDFALSLEVQF